MTATLKITLGVALGMVLGVAGILWYLSVSLGNVSDARGEGVTTDPAHQACAALYTTSTMRQYQQCYAQHAADK